MSGLNHHRLEGKIAAARLAIGVERLWAAALWPVLVVSLFLALIFSGLLPWLPFYPRICVLGVLLAAFLWSLRPLFRLSWPGRHLGMRRIEEKSSLNHRPVSAHDDRLVGEEQGSQPQAIWQEHKLRQLRQLQNLKVGQPRSAWRDLDARALRLPALLAVLASFLLGQGSPSANLVDSLQGRPSAIQAVSLSLDAWLKPPAYTGKPPVMLTSPAMVERLKTEPDILVPENSILTLRIAGSAKPRITLHEISDAPGDTPEVANINSINKREKDRLVSETKLTRPLLVKVSDGSSTIAQWRVLVIPDVPPTVAFTADPAGDASGTLTVKWKAADDYGVTGITSEISLADNQDDGYGIEGNGIFLFEPPKFPVSLRKASPKEDAGTATADLTEHPWAGFMVEMALTATDAAKHAGTSQTRTFRMPERLFIKPLAKALIEQRRHLIIQPAGQGQVAQMLDALITYPDGLVEGSGAYLAIATIVSRLNAASNQDDVDVAINLLWQTAIGIEDGSMADARAALEVIRKELEKALAEGASPERIAELMEKLRSALDRYMQSLQEQTDKMMRQGRLDQGNRQGQTISPDDLRKMLDTIEKLAQSGANDAAKQLLSQLDEILRNLQPGNPNSQMSQQGDSPMSKMLDQLSELMRRQQGLMDDTQRMQQPGEGDRGGQEDREPGGRGQRLSPEGLAGEQQSLSEMLQELMGQLGQNGVEAPPALGEAGKNMQGAEGSLRRGDRDNALGDQGEAIAKLREGAQGMVKQLMQQGQGQQGNYGRHGEARGDSRDPLGRPMPNHSEDTGPERNMLPSELAIRRAREILDMLRSRANEPQLPRIERDYIDRLLRGLY